MRCVTAIFLMLSLLFVSGTALAEDEDSKDSGSDSEAGGGSDPWERPPPDEAPPAGEGREAAAKEDKAFGDGRPLQVGLAVGYGFETEGNQFGAHPYGLGGGLRAGYTLDMGVFVGLSTTYFLGSSADGPPLGLAAAPIDNSVSAWIIDLEIGYDLWLGPLIFRPSAEIGTVLTFLSYDQRTGGSGTRGAMVIGPGATLIYPMGEFYLGGDMRIILPMGEGQGTVTLMGVTGLRFETKLF